MGCTIAALAGLAIEGLANLGVFVSDVASLADQPLAERRHTRHDATLGWTNEPGRRVPDLYGPGASVTIDERGFRASPVAIAGDAVAVVCSGDSFTFGYGVDDADTWPAQMTSLDDRLASVNLGLGGYGLDQSYLRYLRDGAPIAHAVHVVAFVSDDITRMTSRRFAGYSRPWLERTDGAPAVRGVPVPDDGYESPWMTQNAYLFRRIGVVEAARRISGSGRAAPLDHSVMTLEQAADVAWDALRHLRVLGAERGVELIVVVLPTQADIQPNTADFLREPMVAALRGDGLHVLDLVEELRARPPTDPRSYFIPEGAVDFPGAAGHYTRAGNRWVAAQVLPAVRSAARLAPR